MLQQQFKFVTIHEKPHLQRIPISLDCPPLNTWHMPTEHFISFPMFCSPFILQTEQLNIDKEKLSQHFLFRKSSSHCLCSQKYASSSIILLAENFLFLFFVSAQSKEQLLIYNIWEQGGAVQHLM